MATPNIPTKIKLTKCNHESVKAQLAVLKLDDAGSLKKCVDRLKAYYQEHENDKGMEIAGCDVCGGDSDANLDACPFCGEAGVMDGGVPVGSTTESKAEAKPPPKPKAPAKKSKAPVKPKVPAKKSKASAKPQPPPPKRRLTPKAKAAAAKADKTPTPAKVAPPKAQPDTTVASAAIITVKQLDEQVTIIREEVQKGALSMHTIGTAFKQIHKDQLWKMRMVKGDVSRYGNFGQFCLDELGFTKQHVYRTIAVAEHYTAQQVAGLSGQQIRAVQMLKPEAQGPYLNGATGEGTEALSNRASNLQGDKSPPAPIPDKAVTVAMAMGIQKVAMYARPKKNAKVADPETAKPAVSMADKPWLVVELTNQVRMIVRIDQAKDGTLQAAVEFRRGEPVI